MTEINLCPVQRLSEGGPLQPFHVRKLSAIVNGDRLKNFSEQDRTVFPFDTVQRLYHAFRGSILYPHKGHRVRAGRWSGRLGPHQSAGGLR